MNSLAELKIKLFADGADKQSILDAAADPLIKGFTTNPTLLYQAGVKDYRAFAREIAALVPDRPFSFEVFADEFAEMEAQAREISSWGDNIYVKIPITNTRQQSSRAVIEHLVADGIKLNVTAVMSVAQAEGIFQILSAGPGCFLSVFAGRIADTGRDPLPIIAEILKMISYAKNIEMIWSSPRELLNIFQADAVGCHIITLTADILKKLPLIGKDLEEFSLDTVKMFYRDVQRLEFKF